MPFCIYSQVYLLIQRGGTAEGERPAGDVDDRAHGQHGQLPRAVSYPSSHASAGMWTEISIASMSSDVGMIALRKAVPT